VAVGTHYLVFTIRKSINYNKISTITLIGN